MKTSKTEINSTNGNNLLGMARPVGSDPPPIPVLSTVSVGILIGLNSIAPVESMRVEVFLLLFVAGVLFDLFAGSEPPWRTGSGWQALGLAMGFPGLGAGWLVSLHMIVRTAIGMMKGRSWKNLHLALPVVAALAAANFGPESNRILLTACVYLSTTLVLNGFSGAVLRKAFEELLWSGLLWVSASYGIWPLTLAVAALIGTFSGSRAPQTLRSLSSQMSTTETTLKASQKKFREEKVKFKGLLSQQAHFNDFQGLALQAKSRRELAQQVRETVGQIHPDCRLILALREGEKLSRVHGSDNFSLAEFEPLPVDSTRHRLVRSADSQRGYYPLDQDYVFLLKVDGPTDERFFDFLEHLLARASLIFQIQDQNRSLETLLQEKTSALHQLAESQSQLLQAEKLAAVGQLAAGIAHELNSPLAAIQLQNRLARKRLAKNDLDGVVRSVETSELASRKAKGIIEGLLTYARASHVGSPKAKVQLEEVVEGTLRLLDERLEAEKIELKTHLESLPPVVVNAREINQILTNLLLNAIDALRERPAPRKIRIDLKAVEQGQQISVFNDGPSIPEETLERIFDPFFTTKEIGSGTGLGLSVAHELALNHGGRLWAVNQEDGVCFHLLLSKDYSTQKA